MEKESDSQTEFFRLSRRTALLVFIVVVITIGLSAVVSVLLQRATNLSIPSLGTIKTLGVEAYWDVDCRNKTEEVKWGEISLGSSPAVILYVRSISNVKVTLQLDAVNWYPATLSDHMNLSWNYDGAIINPGEIVQITLTLSAPYSADFTRYLISNSVNEFSLDIIITTSQSSS